MANFTQKPVQPRQTSALKMDDKSTAVTPPASPKAKAKKDSVKPVPKLVSLAVMTANEESGGYNIDIMRIPTDAAVDRVRKETGVSLSVAKATLLIWTQKAMRANLDGKTL